MAEQRSGDEPALSGGSSNTQNVPPKEGSGATASSAASSARAAPKRNPAFAAMGLPRLRLPSRNWTIFLSIVVGWTAAVQYDRREKRIAHEKWARLVAPLAEGTLPPNALQRKLTVVLAAPPADGIMSAREHFLEYVKPVLVSSGLDWEAVEGRREGDVRAKVAEGIRRRRMKGGEVPWEKMVELFGERDVELLVDEIRERGQVEAWRGTEGNLVIGRHTWKEFVRGLHEGWLGPPTEPDKKERTDAEAEAGALKDTLAAPDALATLSPGKEEDPLTLTNSNDDASPQAGTAETTSTTDTSSSDNPPEGEEKKSDDAKKKPKTRKQPEPTIQTSAYTQASLAKACPETLGPTAIVPEPHLLGFFNFLTRIYRYLTKRHLADDIGRQVAAAALGHHRGFNNPADSLNTEFSGVDQPWSSAQPSSTTTTTDSDPASQPDAASISEQIGLLSEEEPEWHKSVRKRDEDLPGRERVWLDPMVLDPRVAGRMRRFELTMEDEAEARRIEEQIRRERREAMWDVPSRIGRGLLVTLGYREGINDDGADGMRKREETKGSGAATVGNVDKELD